MKTLFETGFGSSRNVWYGRHPSGAFMGSPVLGQDYMTLDEGYRNKYLTKIGSYLNKLQSMSSLLALASSDPMTLRSVMGSDTDNFLSLMNDAQTLYQDVQRVYARFQSDSAEEWYASSSEMDNSENWTRDIDKMYALYQAHSQVPMKAQPLTALPPAAAARPGTLPGMMPGTMPGKAPMTMPAAPQPMILGIPQNTFLIGAGIAGLGLLAVALA